MSNFKIFEKEVKSIGGVWDGKHVYFFSNEGWLLCRL